LGKRRMSNCKYDQSNYDLKQLLHAQNLFQVVGLSAAAQSTSYLWLGHALCQIMRYP
jgi:hypothetical protein